MRDALPGMWEDADLSGGWADSQAADRPSVTDNARAEAERRWPRLYGPEETLTYPREAVREHTRAGFVAGAEWAAARAETATATPPGLTVSEDGSVLNWQGVNYVPQRAETTTATDEDAARVRAQIAVLLTQHAQSVLAREGMFDSDETSEAVDAILALLATARTATIEDAARVLDDVIQHLRNIWSTGHDEAREVIDTAEELLAQALPRLLATARTRPTRDDLARAIRDGLREHGALRPDLIADAVLALYADQPTEAPTSTQWAHRTASGGASVHHSRKAAELARDEYTSRPVNPFEPPPPASLGIWRREVTPWTKDGDDQ